MIGFPYPKRLNSNNAVEQGAAVLLCSVEAAERLGIPRDRWVFPHAGTDGHDTATSRPARPPLVARHPASPAGGRSSWPASASTTSPTSTSTRASRRPCRSPPTSSASGSTAQLTVTGGLSLRRRAVEQLRHPRHRHHGSACCGATPASIGLVTANGGFVTKHAFGVYATEPPAGRVPVGGAAGRGRRRLTPAVAAEDYDGPATIEGYTVMHDRDGAPEHGIVALRTPDGDRPHLGHDRATPTCSAPWRSRSSSAGR